MCMRWTLCALAALLTASSIDTEAQERTWRKYHQSIQMDSMMAEYTVIRTADGLSPQRERYLYRDANGALLVVRNETTLELDGEVITGVGPFHTSIQCVASGETIAFNHDGEGEVSVTVGSAPFTYFDDPESRPLPTSVRVQAGALFAANLSEPCRAAIERFGGVAARFSSMLADVGYEVVDLFFPNVLLGPVTDHSGDPNSEVLPFDPQTTPPGLFELPFGSAYFE